MKDERQHLLTQYAVTRALAESASLNEAAPKILQAVCESLDWQIGALWIVERRDEERLRCVETWHAPDLNLEEFKRLSQERTFAPGEGLPGRVWAERKPDWVTDVAARHNLPRSARAAQLGLHGAFGFPILLEGQVLGVMEFFSREVREPEEPLMNMMASLGSQTGQFIERKRAEEALRASEERYRVVAETASDAIITIDAQSRIVFVNRAAESVFGHAATEMLGQELTMLMPDYMRHLHRAGLERYVETGRRHISWEGVELPGLHKDGHEIPLEISFSEFRHQGQHYFTGIARDITERKQAERELREQKDALARLNEERGRMLAEVSTPVVPVWRDILVLPIIGSLDTERMHRATDAALNEVMRRGARACIIDITGARIVDSHAIANLSHLVTSLKLIGAEAIVTGVTAQAAHSLVSLGVDFSGMRTHRTLAEALAQLIQTNPLTQLTAQATQDKVSSNGTGT